MPFVLDYDEHGNVSGGHYVDELPDQQQQSAESGEDVSTSSFMFQHEQGMSMDEEGMQMNMDMGLNMEMGGMEQQQQNLEGQDPTPAYEPPPPNTMDQQVTTEMPQAPPPPPFGTFTQLAPRMPHTPLSTANTFEPSSDEQRGRIREQHERLKATMQVVSPDMRDKMNQSDEVREQQLARILAQGEQLEARGQAPVPFLQPRVQTHQQQQPQYGGGQMGGRQTMYPRVPDFVQGGQGMLQMQQMGQQMQQQRQGGNGQYGAVYDPPQEWMAIMAENQAQMAAMGQVGMLPVNAAGVHGNNPFMQSQEQQIPSQTPRPSPTPAYTMPYGQPAKQRPFASPTPPTPGLTSASSPYSMGHGSALTQRQFEQQHPSPQIHTTRQSPAYTMPYGLDFQAYGPPAAQQFQRILNEGRAQAGLPAQLSMQAMGPPHVRGHEFGGLQAQAQQQRVNEQQETEQQMMDPGNLLQMPQHMMRPSTNMPQYGGPPQQYQHQNAYELHRHSHPGALLSYGAPPPPVNVRMPPPAPPGSRSHSRASSLRGGASSPSEIQRQGSLALSQFGADAAIIQQTAEGNHPFYQLPPAPTIPMYTFITDFQTHYATDPAALAAFGAACMNYNRRHLDPKQFYAKVYQILYRGKEAKLIEQWREFLPVLWTEQEDMGWFHQAIEKEVDDQMEAELRSGIKAAKRAMEGEAGDGGRVPKKAKERGGETEVRKSLIVKLPVCLQEKTEEKATEKQLLEQGEAEVEDDTQPVLPEPEARRTSKRKKKTPINGFRAGGHLDTTPTTNKSIDDDVNLSTTRDSTPLSSVNNSPPGPKRTNRPLKIAHPKIHKPGHTALPAASVPHIGPIYPTRHAVLARQNRPYVHALCGQGFIHVQDVKHHHHGGANSKTTCPAIKAGKGGAEWNAHESCQVSYPELNYTKVKEGYVILDQASWDRLEKAQEAGLAYKRMLEEGGEEDADGEVVEEVGGVVSAGGEEEQGHDEMVLVGAELLPKSMVGEAEMISQRSPAERVGQSIANRTPVGGEGVAAAEKTAKASKRVPLKREVVMAGPD